MTKSQRLVNKAYASYRDAVGVLAEAHRVVLAVLDDPKLKISDRRMAMELDDVAARAIGLADAADEYSHALRARAKK